MPPKAKTGKSAFVANLQRSNSKIRDDRAVRIGNKVDRAQVKLISGIQDGIDSMTDQLEAMQDLSTDNQNTSLNVISPKFDADAFCTEINKLKTEIKLQKLELEIAEETLEEWRKGGETE